MPEEIILILPDATIDELDEYNDPIEGDWLVIYDKRTGKTKKINTKYFGQSSPSTNYKWISTFDYPVDAIAEHQGEWYLSLQNPNLGKNPASNPLYWEKQIKAGTGLIYWVAAVYTGDPVVVLYSLDGEVGIYLLKNVVRPFLSTDFEAEL